MCIAWTKELWTVVSLCDIIVAIGVIELWSENRTRNDAPGVHEHSQSAKLGQ